MQYYLKEIYNSLKLNLFFNYKLVRFYVDYRIKPHIPPFNLTPANSFNFEICNYTHQVGWLT